MKGLKRISKMMAMAMSVVLLAGAVAFPAMAEEPVKKGWVLNEEGHWNFYDSKGNMAMDQEKTIDGKKYAFDADGRMFCDELFISPEGSEDGEYNRYAFPDGQLAKGWVKLNKEGNTLYDGEGEYFWYYFQNDWNMVKNREFEDKSGQTFAMDAQGHMYSQTWLAVDESGNILDEAELSGNNAAYYQKEGFRAHDKKLLLGDAKEYWYVFDGNGKIKNIVGVASPANADPVVSDIEVASPSNAHPAPARSIDSIDIVGEQDEVMFIPGEPVELKFEVTLNNETYPVKHFELTDDHDMWITETATGIGSIKIKVTDKENGIVTVTCTPKLSQEVEIGLYMDGISSSGSYSLTPQTTGLTQEQQEKAVDAVLEEVTSIAPATAKDNIAQVYENATDTDKTILQEKLLNNSSYETLSANYAVKYGVKEKVEPAEDALALLGNDKFGIAGAALNMDANTGSAKTATLQVATGDESALVATYNHKVAFDITISLGDQGETDTLTLPVKITMPVPKGYDVVKMKLYHIHNGNETKVKFTNNGDGTISFMTDRFSPFVFAQDEALDNNNNNNNNGGSSSSGGGSGSSNRATGRWIMDSVGWWYKNNDGSYPANKWEYLQYNGQSNWFHFNKDGYMDAGWFVDADGKTYYLNPVSNGFKGAMLTGWQQIEGIWYYFNTASDGSKGAMFTNTVTPDGYQVNEKGQWVK